MIKADTGIEQGDDDRQARKQGRRETKKACWKRARDDQKRQGIARRREER